MWIIGWRSSTIDPSTCTSTVTARKARHCATRILRCSPQTPMCARWCRRWRTSISIATSAAPWRTSLQSSSDRDVMKSDFLPYARQLIEEDDVQAVADTLRSDFLTTGPIVADFEKALAERVGAQWAVAVNSG